MAALKIIIKKIKLSLGILRGQWTYEHFIFLNSPVFVTALEVASATYHSQRKQ